jgi:cytochrome P450
MNEEAIAATQQPPRSGTDQARKRRRSPSGHITGQRNTIFQKCLASDSLAAGDKRVDRLAQEAFTIVVAGGEATARVLTTASFHIVANKHRVLSLLRLELETAFPDPDTELDLRTLEKLPWLVIYLAYLM